MVDCSGSPEIINTTTSQAIAEQYANEGEIDDLINMADDQIWAYTGAWDTSILPGDMSC